MEYNTFIGYIPTSNKAGIGWYTNNAHFRYNETLLEHKPKDEIRIFITGGSTAWGAGVKQDQTFAHILEVRLNKFLDHKKKVKVIIAAAGAWASSQERVFIFSYIKEFKPDIIIMFSGWNDIYHAYTGKDYNKEQDYLRYKEIIHPNSLKQDRFLRIAPPEYRKYNSKFYYLCSILYYKYSINKEYIINVINSIHLNPIKIKDNTLENIDVINYLSKKHDFKLVYCLQPSIYTTEKPLSLWEKNIRANIRHSHIGFPEYNIKNYEMLKSSLQLDALEKDYLFIEGDNAIKHEKRSVFTDYIHLGDRGNKLIANYLYNVIIRLDKFKKLVSLKDDSQR